MKFQEIAQRFGNNIFYADGYGHSDYNHSINIFVTSPKFNEEEKTITDENGDNIPDPIYLINEAGETFDIFKDWNSSWVYGINKESCCSIGWNWNIYWNESMPIT